MIIYTNSTISSDLIGIKELQQANLPAALTQKEIDSQGFVTVIHSYDDLKKLNEIEKHVIAKDGDNVVAYLLTMTRLSRFDIPVLVAMFEVFNDIPFAGKHVSDFNYIVVGQVCVDRNYRSIGVLDKCYDFYRRCYDGRYDFAITEIAANNPRSLNAHRRVGFNEVQRYIALDRTEWVIVLWNWNGMV